MSEQLPFNPQFLTVDIFDAESRTERGEERSIAAPQPMSAEETVVQYANKYYKGDVNTLAKALASNGYRLTEVIEKATENPYGYHDYLKLKKIRDAQPEAKKDTETDYLNMGTQNIGEMGVIWDDVPAEDYGVVTATYTDANFGGLYKASDMTADILSSDAAQEIRQWQNNEDLDSTVIRKFTNQNLERKGMFFGNEGYEEAYDKEFKRVVNKLMVDKTGGGKHTATLKMTWDEWTKPSSAFGNEVLYAASPQVKFLGVGKGNQLVYITEGRLRHGLDILDTPKMAAIGLAKYGFSDFERGISERAMASTELYRAGEATGVPGLKYLAGIGGFGIDILFPDLTVVGGVAVKGGKAAVKAGSKLSKAVRAVEDTAKSVTEADKVATELYKIGELFEKAAKNGDRAAVVEASERYADLRKEYPALRDRIDRGVEAYYAEKTEQALEEAGSLGIKTPEDMEEARKFATAAGPSKRTGGIPFQRVVGDEDLAFLDRRIELRTGARRMEAEGRTFALDTSEIPRFDKDFADLDRAERVLTERGAFRLDENKVTEAFAKALKARAREFAEARMPSPKEVPAGQMPKTQKVPKAGESRMPAVSKALNNLSKEAKQVSQELVVLFEHKAGINPATPDALNLANDRVAEFVAKVTTGQDVVKAEAKVAADAAKREAAVAARKSTDDELRKARRLYNEIESELAQNQEILRLKTQHVESIGKELSRAETAEAVAKNLKASVGVKKKAATRAKKLLEAREKAIRDGHTLLELSFLQSLQDAEVLAQAYKTTKAQKALKEAAENYQLILTRIADFEAKGPQRLADLGFTNVTSDMLDKQLETLYAELAKQRKALVRVRGRLPSNATKETLAYYKKVTERYKKLTALVKSHKEKVKPLKAAFAAEKKHLDQLEALATKLRKEQKATAKKVLSLEAKTAKPRPELIDADAIVERFFRQVEDSYLDAFDDAYNVFYEGGKLAKGLIQVKRTREMLNFNMRVTGEALQLLANRIKAGKRVSATALTDSSVEREIREIDIVRELIAREPDLDPATVPSALNLLATKYSIDPEVIAEGMVSGAPVKVTDVKLVKGKKLETEIELTADYITKVQQTAEYEAFLAARRQSPRYALHESFEEFKAESVTGAIDRSLRESATKESALKTGLSYVRDFVLGGAVSSELINLSPSMKRMVQRIPRAVSQTVGDMARLLSRGDGDEIVTYLAGIRGTFSNKRQILSSGLPSVPEVYYQTLARAVQKVRYSLGEDGADTADAIEWLLSRPLTIEGRLPLEELKQKYPQKFRAAEKALHNMFKEGTTAKQIDLGEIETTAEEASLAAGQLVTIPMPRAIIDLMEYTQPDYLNTQELTVETLTMLHALFNSAKNNPNNPRAAVRNLIFGIKRAYTAGDDTQRGIEAMHRALPIMAANTKAYSVIHEIGDYGLALSKEDYTNWVRYTKGQPVPMKWRKEVLQKIIDTTGDSVMFRAIDVMGDTKYIPREAFMAMQSALRKAQDRAVFLRKKGGASGSLQKGQELISDIMATALKLRVYGAFMFRTRFGVDSMYESTSAAMQIGGMTPAALFAIRHFSQMPVMIPGVLQTTHFTSKVAPWATKLFDPNGPLDGAPEIVKAFANMVANKVSPKDAENFFQSIGDAAANKLAQFIGAGRFQLDVNKMLAGSDDIVEIHGKMYSYRGLRDMLVEEGVPGGSLQSNYFAKHVTAHYTGFMDKEKAAESLLSKVKGITKEEAMELLDVVENFAESLGERERLSMFCAFVSSGYTPIEAAEMVRKALFDYQQTMSEFDFKFLVKVLFPYWGFHKNNARFQLDSMFDPLTAYRAGIVRKGPDSAVKLLQEKLNETNTDELGIQLDQLSEDQQTALKLYKTSILKKLGQSQFTEEQKSLMRSILSGVSVDYREKGKAFGTGADQINLDFIRDIVGVSDAMQVNPYVEGYVKTYQQGRPVLFFPSDLTDKDTAFRKQIGAPALFNYLALPESGQAAFATHVLSLGQAGALLALAGTSAIGLTDTMNANAYLEAIPASLENTASPEFNPIVNLLLKTVGASNDKMHHSLRISKGVYDLLQSVGASDLAFEIPGRVVGDTEVEPTRYYTGAWVAAFLNLSPQLAQTMREVQQIEEYATGKGPAVSGEPVFDFGLNTLRLFGLQIERGDPEAVMRAVQPSGEFKTYAPKN